MGYCRVLLDDMNRYGLVITHSFLRRLPAADRATLLTSPSVAVRAVPSSFSARPFPPKTKTRTTTTRMRVRGRAIMGDDSHSRISSKAATPSTTHAQLGIDAEYVSF